MGAFDLGRFLWPDVGQGRLPKSPTPVDRSTALGARVIGGCVPGVVSLRNNGSANVKEFAAGLFGVGSDGGSGNYATASSAIQLTGRSAGAAASNRDFTLVFIGNLTSVNSIWFYDGQSDGAGGSWFVNTNASGQLGAWFGGTINLPAVTLATGPCVLIIHGGTYGGGTSKVWYNGTEYTGSGATDSWFPSPAFATFFGSSAYPTVNTFAGVGNLAVVLRGNVTSAEAQAIRDNPAAIFDTPQSLMWMPPSSGSGTAPGATLTGTASLSAGTATGDASASGATLTGSASLSAGTATGAASATGSTLTGTASLSSGAGTGDGAASGASMTGGGSLSSGSAAGDAAAAGASLTGTASLSAGSASGSGSSTASGANLTGAGSLAAGAATGDAAASGATVTGSGSLASGGASGQSNASAPGATLTGTASLSAGAAGQAAPLVPSVRFSATVPARSFAALVPARSFSAIV